MLVKNKAGDLEVTADRVIAGKVKETGIKGIVRYFDLWWIVDDVWDVKAKRGEKSAFKKNSSLHFWREEQSLPSFGSATA